MGKGTMTMSNSSLVDYVKWSPNNSGQRRNAIDIITIHMVVGQCSVEALGDVFANPSRQASSNYGIGYDGRIGQYVDEANRSWCSSSSWNDNRAITIETASDNYYPYAVNDIAYMSLLTLCTDICQRNSKNKLLWYPTWDEFETHYGTDPDVMYMTLHKWFAATSCPGQYLEERMRDIASNVTKLLKTFTDVTPDMSAYRAIEWMASQGYVQGYKDGTFRPSQPLTRAQFCTIMWRMAGRP
jgi:hypothetical protein